MGKQSRIRNWLGLNTDSYARSFFIDSNIKSSMYMSVILIVFSLGMIISSIIELYRGEIDITQIQIIVHLSLYVGYTLAAIFNFYICERYIKGHSTGHERQITAAFAVISVVFGIYLSTIDFLFGNQILIFVSMVMFASCLLVWRPFISIVTVSASFLIFYFIMIINGGVNSADTLRFFVLWGAILTTSISFFNQKLAEAKKNAKADEASTQLSRTSSMDKVTGVANMDFFSKHAATILKEKETNPGSKIFLYLDIENFKVINSKFGYASGNAFLAKIAGLMIDTFPDALVARQGDDHFVVFTARKGVKERITQLRRSIISFDSEVQIGLKVGAYVPDSSSCDPNLACDNARLACQQIKKKYDQDYCEYDSELDKEIQMNQYIVNNVDAALDRGDIKVYYQPVVWARNGKVCGYEALVKWQDSKYGFLSPGVFIPVLEEYRQVHKVDMIVVDTVFRDIRKMLDMNKPVAPVSLNFSRLDFELTDVVDLLEACASTYNVSRDYIHVEVTESALSDNLDTLKDDLAKLKKLGYPLWLDDFGSGYSSLNVLKDFDFDVMKIDMVFLSAFEEKTEKTKAVLKNVVNMATDLGMHTLTEGVETKEQYAYLKEIGCERLQGYLFGKPMPLDEIIVKVSAGTLPVSEEFINA